MKQAKLAVTITLTLMLAANTCIAAESKESSVEKTFRQRVEEMIAKRNAEFAIIAAKPNAKPNIVETIIDNNQVVQTTDADINPEDLLKESQSIREKLETFLSAPEKPVPVQIETEESVNAIQPVENQPIQIEQPKPSKKSPTYNDFENQEIIIKENAKLDTFVDNSLNVDTQFFTYTRGETNRIYCAPGFVTDIQLQHGEEILNAQVGDKMRWNIDIQFTPASGWHIYAKPIQLGVVTNMIVTTDRHTYMMELVADPNYTPIVSWFYPGEARPSTTNVDQVMEVESVDKLNFEYLVSKSKKYDWTPKFVFDDGFNTYINLPDGSIDRYVPVIFMKLDSGSLILLDYTISNNNLVVDKVCRELVMRVDNKIVNIKNQRREAF